MSLPGAPSKSSDGLKTKEMTRLWDLFVSYPFKTKHGIGERTLLSWKRSGQSTLDLSLILPSVICFVVVKYAEREIYHNF